MRDESGSTVFLRLPAVVQRTGRSRTAIYTDIGRGTFPKPVRLAERSVGWIEAEIEAWCAERVAARDAKAAA